jgi:Zn ribbon nucleic-acid-binding protein
MSRCPKCGNTDAATIWEDNFWSGCSKCGWCASCEHNVVLVRNNHEPEIDHAAWRKYYGYDSPDEE